MKHGEERLGEVEIQIQAKAKSLLERERNKFCTSIQILEKTGIHIIVETTTRYNHIYCKHVFFLKN